ncbi:GFA family protein [Novosphingobium olei]|uniref:GFA family protein n=1 Tax=Novosphingobium olei TaxID=2728851 RepID=UPI003BB1D4D9
MDLRKTILSNLAEMAPPITGACLCGNVRYTCTESPIWSVNCHCRSCQRLSGAPFVSAFSVPAHAFAVSGETMSFRRSSDSGHEVTTAYCGSCGARIHAQSAGARHLMNVFASSLTDPSAFRPIANVYLKEAVGWMDPPETMLNFPGMPHT